MICNCKQTPIPWLRHAATGVVSEVTPNLYKVVVTEAKHATITLLWSGVTAIALLPENHGHQLRNITRTIL